MGNLNYLDLFDFSEVLVQSKTIQFIWYKFIKYFSEPKSALLRKTSILAQFPPTPSSTEQYVILLRVKLSQFNLVMRLTFSTVRVVNRWNELPWEVVDSPARDAVKSRPDGSLEDTLNKTQVNGFKTEGNCIKVWPELYSRTKWSHCPV